MTHSCACVIAAEPGDARARPGAIFGGGGPVDGRVLASSAPEADLTTPACCPGPGSEVEAAARAGHLDRAILLADDLERRARRMRRRRALGVVQRGRAIVAATRRRPGGCASCRPAHRFEPSVACPHPSRRRAACSCSGPSSAGGERSGPARRHVDRRSQETASSGLGPAPWSRQAAAERAASDRTAPARSGDPVDGQPSGAGRPPGGRRIDPTGRSPAPCSSAPRRSRPTLGSGVPQARDPGSGRARHAPG